MLGKPSWKGGNQSHASLMLPFLVCILDFFQEDEKAADGGMMPDAKEKDPNSGEQTEGSKWQRPRLTRKSLMKCCLVKWIIASTTQQGPGRRTRVTSLFHAFITCFGSHNSDFSSQTSHSLKHVIL